MLISTKGRYRYQWFVMVCIAVVLSFSGIRVGDMTALADSTQTVRVGWYQSAMFQEGTSDEAVKSGYCYDYLQTVSNYTNWRYQYVYGEWTELFHMLQSGEIDFLGGVSMTEERKETMLFPDSAMGNDQYYLYKHSDDTSITTKDLSSLSGKKAGGIRDNRMTAFTEQWIRENNVDLEIVYFDSFKDQEEAFDRREIDLLTQTINNVLSMDGISIVVKVGEEPFYLAVSKSCSDLLGQLNAAVTNMLSIDPFILQNMQYENYGATLTVRTMSEEEKQWITNHPVLTIGYLNDYLPFSDTGKDGQVDGVLTDVMDAIIADLGLSQALTVRYIPSDSYNNMVADLKSGEIDAAFPVYGDLWSLEQNNINASASVMTSTLTFFYKGTFNRSKIRTIAVNTNNGMQIAYCAKYFPNVTMVYCDSIEECLDFVAEGKADGTLINTFRMEIATGNSKYKALSYVQLNEKTKRCFGVRETDTELLLILNRGLRIIGTSFGVEHAYKYMESFSRYTIVDLIRDNSLMIGAVMLVLAGAIVGSLMLSNRRKMRLITEKESYIKQISELNSSLKEYQAHLEESAVEQEAQIEEISALNGELEERQAQLEETTAEQEAQIEEIDRLNHSIQKRMSMVQSLASVYFVSFYIDLEHDSFTEIAGADFVRKYLGGIETATQAMEIFCAYMVKPEFAETLRSFTDLSTLSERMGSSSVITCDYIGNVYGWCQLYLIAGDRSDDGKLRSAFLAARIIHAEKEREQAQNKEIEKARLEAESANRAKTRFLFNMSHDIRTPMNAILGYINLMSKNMDDRNKQQDYIEKLRNSSDILLSLINNVLEMARIDSGKASLDEKSFRTGEMTYELSSVYSELMKAKHIRFTYENNTHMSYIWGDKVKLNEIFLNLLSNAYKYTPEGGEVSMTLQELPGTKPDRITVQTVISDTGIGMSKEYLPKLFEEFSREKNSTDAGTAGTGLGMPIVKKLVELMNGTITVKSELGKGTTFVVTIPHRIAEAGESFAEQAAVQNVAVLKGKRILLAEDNDLNAEIAMELLSDFSCSVERAADGIICVDMLMKKPAGYYNVILMDIQMPNLDGYGATRRIRALDDPGKANIPIIAMTANAFAEDKQDAYAAGMNDHLAKPIEIPKLIEVLTHFLE